MHITALKVSSTRVYAMISAADRRLVPHKTSVLDADIRPFTWCPYGRMLFRAEGDYLRILAPHTAYYEVISPAKAAAQTAYQPCRDIPTTGGQVVRLDMGMLQPPQIPTYNKLSSTLGLPRAMAMVAFPDTPVNRGHWREGFPAEGENLTMVPVLLSQRVLLMMNQLGARTVRSITTHTVSLQKWPPTNKLERQNYSLVTRSLP